ncbi:metallophosphoesterase family protein [uncultured Veillonella sp.]|uniref:purple acid phosphatase family protein n=1 Tax=uncultured Veillonella sp. TaxID=159268 RepID=UPI0026151EFB|nr:metallophosphoesterase family protein [uncultured Veillonella sp.]
MKQSKSKFIWGGILAVIVVLTVAVIATPWGRALAHYVVREGRSAVVSTVPSAGLTPKYIRQLVTPDMSTSRIIMWETEKPQEDPVVLYKEKGAADTTIITVPATMDTFTEDGVTRYIYRAHIKDLTPNKEYAYRVGPNMVGPDWSELNTRVNGEFTALVFPDSQSSDYRGWKELVKTAYAQYPEAAFYVNMGDLVDNGESAYQWDSWFDAVEPMAARIPLAAVMGNHEYYSLDWKVKTPNAFDHFFRYDSPILGDGTSSVTANGTSGGRLTDNSGVSQDTATRSNTSLAGVVLTEEQQVASNMSRRAYYSYDYGDVHFVVLNTQFNEMDEAYRDAVMNEELAWLRSDLAATTKPWKVVLMHKDTFRYPYTKNPNIEPGFNELAHMFMPIFDEYKVDLVLSAHLHMYRRRGHVEDFKRSETGPSYVLTGVAGDVKYANIWLSHPFDEYVSPYVDGDNYLVLERKGADLTVKAYLQDGTLFDEMTLSK